MTPWFITLPWLHYLDFTYNEVYHEARFEKDKRYYVLRLEKDLLDDWTITAINGRIKSKLGQRRILAFSTYAYSTPSRSQIPVMPITNSI